MSTISVPHISLLLSGVKTIGIASITHAYCLLFSDKTTGILTIINNCDTITKMKKAI